jgi:guanylate kinase
MSIQKDGIMVILSSPSGAGKTTLVKLLSKNKNFQISISHTTRKPRSSEIPDQDYYFVNHKKFERLVKNEEFLEYAKVFSHYYGTTITPVIERLEKGKNVIFDIDWQGADQIKNKELNYKLITFFILPPSKEVLFERLSNRDMKDKLIVEERMKDFSRDVLHWINYDYVIINDDLNNCYSKINNLIEAEIDNGSKDYDKEYIRKHVDKLTS